MIDIESIVEWYRSDVTAAVEEEQVLRGFHSAHPRIHFLKGLPLGSSVLDVGAGDGTMHLFRNWLTPARNDLKMYAYSLEKGLHFDSYDGFEIGNWDEHPPSFDGRSFDAIFSAHFIEHIQDTTAFFAWAASRLTPDGRIYTEWPSDRALRTPTKAELKLQGIDVFLGNYYDDLTHRSFPSRMRVLRGLRRSGLEVEAAATIRLPLFETQLLGHYRRTGDTPTLQQAYWLRSGWCQYIVARKVAMQGADRLQPGDVPSDRDLRSPLTLALELLARFRQDQAVLRQLQMDLHAQLQGFAELERKQESLRVSYSALADEHAALRQQLEIRYESVQRQYSQLLEEHAILRQQVAMASHSRWCTLGRIFGVGPRFR